MTVSLNDFLNVIDPVCLPSIILQAGTEVSPLAWVFETGPVKIVHQGGNDFEMLNLERERMCRWGTYPEDSSIEIMSVRLTLAKVVITLGKDIYAEDV